MDMVACEYTYGPQFSYLGLSGLVFFFLFFIFFFCFDSPSLPVDGAGSFCSSSSLADQIKLK